MTAIAMVLGGSNDSEGSNGKRDTQAVTRVAVKVETMAVGAAKTRKVVAQCGVR